MLFIGSVVTTAHVTSTENQPLRTLYASKNPRLKAKVFMRVEKPVVIKRRSETGTLGTFLDIQCYISVYMKKGGQR